MEHNCEAVRIAAMALADGHTPALERAQVEAHIGACAACREELEQLRQLGARLASQERRRTEESLWPQVRQRLEEAGTARSPFIPRPLWALAALLAIYKLIEFVPERDLGPAIQLVPVLIALAIFRLLRENPFHINTELTLEGE